MKAWAPTEEEFTAWRDEPVTQWVLTACEKSADENARAWMHSAWTSGKADQEGLLVCRTRADAYRALAETEYAGWLATHEGSEQ